MTMNDPLANVLSHMLNSERLGKTECVAKPVSKLITNVLKLLQEKHYIGDFSIIEDGKGNMIKINLVGKINKCGVIKPKFAVKKDNYIKFEKRFLPARDFGVLVVSTPKGLMTHNEAVEKGHGGKLIAYCY
jgi:small subunit ribosomal protein S8